MATTVSYKGSTLTTVNNQTKTLKTAGKYMEDDVTITDVSEGGSAIVVTEEVDSTGGTNYIITAVDLSEDTVRADVLYSGYTAHNSSGVAITGTASGGTPINNQNKTISPLEIEQNVSADSGYTGLGTVTVSAISSSYVGSGIARNSASDLNASGDTVTVPPGYYSSPASKSVSSGIAGTPTATKGTVSNHSVSVTPSVANTSGYITGGTKTGTAVTVYASELVSGNKSITENGTNIDVVNYSTVSVSVSSGGTSKNTQISSSVGRATTSSYTNTNVGLTVSKTGTYHVYWFGYRSSTSGTSGSELYVNGSLRGSAITTFNTSSGLTNTQNVHLTNISLNANDVITIYARSRGNNYYMYVGNLTIIEA